MKGLQTVKNSYFFNFQVSALPSFQVSNRKGIWRWVEGERKVSSRGTEGDPAKSPTMHLKPWVAKTNKFTFFLGAILDHFSGIFLNLRPMSIMMFGRSQSLIVTVVYYHLQSIEYWIVFSNIYKFAYFCQFQIVLKHWFPIRCNPLKLRCLHFAETRLNQWCQPKSL